MNNEIFKLLKKDFISDPFFIDKLFVSAFIKENGLVVKRNKLLKKYSIKEKEKEEFKNLELFMIALKDQNIELTLENLINLFEFVVSPADRIVTGAVYTPLYIRDFIINRAFEYIPTNMDGYKIADISCGCGGFLFSVAQKIKQHTDLTFSQIFSQHIFGLDIQPYSITRSKLLLSLLALTQGEDIPIFDFQLYTGDALSFKWDKTINGFQGFDVIVGNPPYVRYRNLNEETKVLLKNWDTCNIGLTDLYIPFFQIGIENLKSNGILGYITMNTFFKSLNGRLLRKYFQEKKLEFDIIDFGSSQIFASKNTYTCICIIKNITCNCIKYVLINKNDINSIPQFKHIEYVSLNCNKGWNLQEDDIIRKIEQTGTPFGKLYKTRHGIATLKNSIYIFKPIKEDVYFYYLKERSGNIYKIEKDICKDIINSNRLKDVKSVNEVKAKIIFPYTNHKKPNLMKEEELKNNFPNTYKYLLANRQKLHKRDKGNGNYENWFAYGRTQSLEKFSVKLFFPKMTNSYLNCIIEVDENLLYYNGQAILGNSVNDLLIIKKLMESTVFWYYIRKTSKPYSAGYFSIDGNYINNFGVCDLSQSEKEFVIKEENKSILNSFWETKYGITMLDSNE